MIPVFTLPASNIVYSIYSCLQISVLSFVSFFVWSVAIHFAKYRFQISLDLRKNGLWLTSHSNFIDKTKIPPAVQVSSWKNDSVYFRGSSALSADGNHAMNLHSYSSTKDRPPDAPLAIDIARRLPLSTKSLDFFIVKFEWCQKQLFNLLVSENNHLSLSVIMSSILTISAVLSAFITVLILRSRKVKKS